MFGLCCIAELICNKMRSSEINLHVLFWNAVGTIWNWLELSEIHLETSEVDLNYLKFTWTFLKLTWSSTPCRTQNFLGGMLWIRLDQFSRLRSWVFRAFVPIFFMLGIEQAKIYREPNFGGWTIGKLKCQILASLIWGRHVGVPLLLHQ